MSLLALLAYGPALHGPLLLDDSHVIAPLLESNALGRDWRIYLFGEAGPFGRPVAMATFVANALVHGGDLWWWKATNLVLHIVIGWVVYLLFGTLVTACGGVPAAARVIALCGASLWLLHPLHMSTVMYTTQRMTQLSTLFTLVALLLYARARCAGLAARRNRLALLAAFLVCTPLAIASKETGLLTPFFLAALELTVFAGRAWPRPRWLSGLLLGTTVLPLLGGLFYVAGDVQARFLNAYTLREFGPLERLLTEGRILVTYLRWIVAPSRAAMGFYHDDVRVSQALPGEADTAAAWVLLLVLAGGAWWWRRRAPLAAFGITLFFVGHALESTVFGLELMFEHRNYLPSVGIILCICALARAWPYPRLAALAAAGAGALFALVTATSAAVWGDAPALYRSFLAAHPQSVRARVTLAEWHAAQRDFPAALALLGDSGKLTLRLHALRVYCARDGAPPAGHAPVLAAAAQAPRTDYFAQQVVLLLARHALDGDCRLDDAALAAAVDGMRDRPMPSTRRYRYYIYAALLQQRQGEAAVAQARLRTATALAPEDPYPWYLGAEWAADAGDREQARTWLAEARRRARRDTTDFTQVDAAVAAMLDDP